MNIAADNHAIFMSRISSGVLNKPYTIAVPNSRKPIICLTKTKDIFIL
jgi:hypothetical protein